MALLEDVREKLVNDGIVEGSSGWKCFVGFLPSSPDRVIALYETAGQAPEPRSTMRRPSFQVRGRGQDKTKVTTAYSDLRAKMEEIYQALHTGDIDNTTTSPTDKYPDCQAVTSAPLAIGEDENHRQEFTWNFTVIANS